jgi:hypothetical protein
VVARFRLQLNEESPMRATWYVLEDGNVVDPNECAPDEAGNLRHKDGVAVARRGDVYSSRSVELPADREMKPAASSRRYRTRGGQAG